MARSIWTGSLSFGLVNIPVAVFPATRDKSIHFNQFEAGTPDRIRYRKVNERTGSEVEAANIVKGFDLGGGDYVLLSDEELESAAPDKSRNIEITDFVDLGDIDPVFYRTTYYLAPQGEAAAKAYALLRKAMREANKVGIATWVHRNKEYLVAVRPDAEVMALETMFFADEVRSAADEMPALPSDKALTAREVDMAKMLIESMTAPWDPEQYHDTHRRQVEAIIDQKRQGKQIVTESPVPQSTKVVDLMEALQASVRARGAGRAEPAPASGRSRAPGRTGAGAKKAPAARKPSKKAPAKKAPARRAPAAKKPAPAARQRKAS
ncbi:MAG: Ku protein [Acidimicrobiales bacterium]